MSDSDPIDPRTEEAFESAETRLIEPVTCLACGCLCDDISVVQVGEHPTEARGACPIGREWLLRDRSHADRYPVARIKGEPAGTDDAVTLAASLLTEAKAPIILGLTSSTCQTVAAALELAERIGAVIDIGDGRTLLPRILAYQRTGRISATLGEVKNRADVVVFWGADPVVTHPRHWERYSVEPRGRFVPDGRKGRTVIVIDCQHTVSAEQADLYIEIDEGRQFEVLWTLRALVRGVEIDPDRAWRSTGCHLDDLRRLASRLIAARYGAFFQGPLLSRGTMIEAAAVIEAAHLLVRDLNHQTHFVTLGMGESGNAQGAEAVFTWQSGFPSSLDLGAGHPRSLPGVTSALDRLARDEADVAVIVGDVEIDGFPSSARKQFRTVSKIVIAPPDRVATELTESAVWMSAATPGLEEDGSVMRVDGVSLLLRPIRRARFPSARSWIDAIRTRISLRNNLVSEAMIGG
jgi:formylmethanofuran dehydrogenase subunit B